MAKIRRSNTDCRNYLVIPKKHEIDNEELMEGKYKNKKVLIGKREKDGSKV